jgi:hypothetical protein
MGNGTEHANRSAAAGFQDASPAPPAFASARRVTYDFATGWGKRLQ